MLLRVSLARGWLSLSDDLEEPKPVNGMMRIQYYLDGEWHTLSPSMMQKEDLSDVPKGLLGKDNEPA